MDKAKLQTETVFIISKLPFNTSDSYQSVTIASVEELPHIPCFALILVKEEENELITSLKNIRTIPEYKFTPIFYHGELSEKELALFDGPADDNLVSKAQAIHSRLNTLPANYLNASSQDLILLTYLFSRQGAVVKGNINHNSPRIYDYPLLNLLFSEERELDAWRFLQNLVMRDLLNIGPLLNEIRICTHCNSGLLNIKNNCPNCHSLNIQQQKFIHCYLCGKIGPIPEFLQQKRLVCSQCGNQLKQIGIDYDKPLENYFCNDCKHYFSQPETNLMCLVCHQISLPFELTTRRLYDYSLSKRGEYYVKGMEKEVYCNFQNFFSIMEFNAFMALIAWQARLAKRYSSLYFSVIGVQIEVDGGAAIDEIEEISHEFFNDLRQVFRDSDLSTQVKGTVLFFLPMTNQAGCVVLFNRIRQFLKQFFQNHAQDKMLVSLSYLTSNEIISNQLEGELVLMELQARSQQIVMK